MRIAAALRPLPLTGTVPGDADLRAATRPLETVGLIALVAAGLGGAYAVGALLPFWFIDSPEQGVAFFPPAGLTVAALVLTPKRLWPVWLAAAAVAELAVDLSQDQALGMAIGFALANTAEPLLGASMVLWLFTRTGKGSTLQGLVLFMLGAVVVGPALGGAIGATVATLTTEGPPWAEVAGRWWLGDGLGVLAVATPIVMLSIRSRWDAPFSATRLVTATLAAVAIAVVPAVQWGHPMIYAVLPILMWPALLGDRLAVAVAGSGVAFGADWAAVTGRADRLVAPGNPGEMLAFVQLFLVVTLVPAIALAAVVVDRRRTEQILGETRRRWNRAELAAVTAAQDERRRVARDLHDVVGHALNVVVLHGGAARRALHSDEAKARELLESIEATGRRALEDLDVALELVADVDDTRASRDLSSLPDLVDTMELAGLRVELVVVGRRGQLSTLQEWSAYRILEEALTNAARHAPRAHVEVRVAYDDGGVGLAVTNGPAPTPQPPERRRSGRGLAGMRERVALLGGWMEAGPLPDGGYAVHVWLPRSPR